MTKKADSPSGLAAPAATSVLTANTATLNAFNFVGIVNLPVDGGTPNETEQAMEFTASSASLSGDVTVSVTQETVSHTIQTATTQSSDLEFSDDMTLYATKLCGTLEGIIGPVCFTPSTVSALFLKIASVLGVLAPITMTNVTTYQPLSVAGDLQATALSVN